MAVYNGGEGDDYVTTSNVQPKSTSPEKEKAKLIDKMALSEVKKPAMNFFDFNFNVEEPAAATPQKIE